MQVIKRRINKNRNKRSGSQSRSEHVSHGGRGGAKAWTDNRTCQNYLLCKSTLLSVSFNTNSMSQYCNT